MKTTLLIIVVSFLNVYCYSLNDTTMSKEAFPEDDDFISRYIDKLGKSIGVKEKEYQDDDEDFEIKIYKYKLKKKSKDKTKFEYITSPKLNFEYGNNFYKGMPFKDNIQRTNFLSMNFGEEQIYEKDNVIKSNIDLWRFSYKGWQMNDKNNNKLKYDVWSLGLQENTDWGYKFDFFTFQPTVKKFYELSKVKFNNKMDYTDTHFVAFLNRYEGNFRYSYTNVYGVNVKLWNVGIGVSYNQQVIYPRIVFWKVAISELLEKISWEIVDGFFKNLPAGAKPVFYSLFNAGIKYGWTKLRTDNLNWPYQSEKPMVFENVGLSFTINF